MTELLKAAQFCTGGILAACVLFAGGCAGAGTPHGDLSSGNGARETQEPLVVAHRGASRDAPENTLPAFRLAWERGADAIEGDFRRTKDGHVVCIHDAETERVADKKLVVSESSLKELRALDVGAHRGEEYSGTVIPTLAEVLEVVPAQKQIYIEIKGGPSMVPAVLEEVRESDLAEEQVTLISFDEDVIRTCTERAPAYRALWLSGFKKDKAGRVIPSVETVLATLDDTGADGFSSSHDLVTADLISQVKEKGYGYHVWTVDEAAAALQFRRWGADSITTNVPGAIREALYGAGGSAASQ